jgi:hypothetical protein
VGRRLQRGVRAFAICTLPPLSVNLSSTSPSPPATLTPVHHRYRVCPQVHQSWVLGLDVRVDGLQLASASGDRTLGVWRSLPCGPLQQAAACVGDGVRRAFWRAFGGGTLGGGGDKAGGKQADGSGGDGGKPAKVLPVPLKTGGGVL